MNPDVRLTEHLPKRTPRTARRSERRTGTLRDSALQALSAATDRYTRLGAGRHHARQRPNHVLAAVAAIIVGVTLTLAGRFVHRCAATLRITGEGAPAAYAVYRKELLDYAWDRVGDSSETGFIPRHWFVDSPGDGVLQLCLITPDSHAGVECARQIATGFRDKMQAAAAVARETPTRAEDILSQYVQRLQMRLSEVQKQVDAAIMTLPETDPSEHRTAMLSRWQSLYSDFDAAREQLAEASADVARLQANPQLMHGLVTTEEYQQALGGDAALQQDLRELATGLSELKLHLLNVWQESAGPLEHLVLAVEDLIATASPNREHPRAQENPRKTQALVVTVEAYRDMLTTFAQTWTRKFTALRGLEIDPHSGEVLDVYQHSRRLLNDFLFDATKRLASMRLQVLAIAEGSSDSARHHVFRSNLVRAFQTMQAAHHRLEFAAGTIETPDNFRLDAALKSTRGLRRRSQDRIRAINEALQARAAEHARKRRIKELTKAEKLVELVRTATDQTVDELLALQKELNLNAEVSQAFLRAVLKAEIATARLKLTQDDLGIAKDRLEQLAAERVSTVEAVEIEFVSAGVVGRPVNLAQRLGTGALAAALIFVTVLFAQWWITRRT